MKKSYLFYLGLATGVFLMLAAFIPAQEVIAQPRKRQPSKSAEGASRAARLRSLDKSTSPSKASIVLTDDDIKAGEINRMNARKDHLVEWATKLSETTGEALNSADYAEEYEKYNIELSAAQTLQWWDMSKYIALPDVPEPTETAKEALKARRDEAQKLAEEEAAKKEAELQKQKEQEETAKAEEAKKLQMEEEARKKEEEEKTRQAMEED